MSYYKKLALATRKWGFGFNEASKFKYLPTVHINQPQGMVYFSYWPLKIRTYKYNPKKDTLKDGK